MPNESTKAGLGVFLVALALSACAVGPATPGDVGSTGLAITLSPNVIVEKVDYRISGNGITPITGSINVTGEAARVSLLVSSIPANVGYLLEVSATSTDGLTTCAAQVTFAVVASLTTQVPVVLMCTGPDDGRGRVVVNGRLNNCPSLTGVSASPLQAPVGGAVTVQAAAADRDNDPLTFAWTSTADVGSFVDAAAPATSFRCTAPGTTTLSVTVSDGTCAAIESIPIACAGPATCLLDDTYTFSSFYGLVPRSEIGTLSPPATFRFDRRIFGVPGVVSCLPALPACADPAATDLADIITDITDPDVQAALAQPVPPLYGDRLVADAESFSFRRADGRGFGIVVGFECTTPSSRCVPTPPGVRRLVTDLRSVANLGFQDRSCMPVVPPPSCNACTVAECDSYTAGCDSLADASDRQLCQAAYRCFVEEACTMEGDPTHCFCGTSGLSCFLPGAANGACLNEVAAASKTTPDNADAIRARFVDPSFPIGHATTLVNCQGLFCQAECALP